MKLPSFIFENGGRSRHGRSHKVGAGEVEAALELAVDDDLGTLGAEGCTGVSSSVIAEETDDDVRVVTAFAEEEEFGCGLFDRLDKQVSFFAMLTARRWSAFCLFISTRRFCVAVSCNGSNPAAEDVVVAEDAVAAEEEIVYVELVNKEVLAFLRGRMRLVGTGDA